MEGRIGYSSILSGHVFFFSFFLMTVLASVLFGAGYLLITLEHRFHMHKAVTATALGAGLWTLIAFMEGHGTEVALEEVGSEIFGLIVFLLAAMTLVEILIHYRFFDLVYMRLQALKLTDIHQFWLIGILAFFLSAVIDNLTTTIVMLQIARRFFKGKNLLIAAAGIVIAANAGGAFSPIGDVTTIMLWLAGKFRAPEIILWGFLPALVLFGTSMSMLAKKLQFDTADQQEKKPEAFLLLRSEKLVIMATFASFALPVIAHFFGLPPYIGLLFGIGAVGTLVTFFTKIRSHQSHLSLDVEKILKRTDLASILFFIGILLAVGALRHLHILSAISQAVFGSNPSLMGYVLGNSFLGLFSAIVDNIPLTAAAIDIVHSTDPAIWVMLALAVGTGGSILVIGSAAGVVAMGILKEITFKNYMQIASIPAFVGYVAAILTWYIQYQIFR